MAGGVSILNSCGIIRGAASPYKPERPGGREGIEMLKLVLIIIILVLVLLIILALKRRRY
jgi:hypothetical protein